MSLCKDYGYNISVDTLADLRQIDGGVYTDDKKTVLVRGHTTVGKGGGVWYWDNSDSSSADNDGTIVKATGVTVGRWKRTDIDDLSVLDFGADDTDTNDSVTAFTNAAAFGVDIIIPEGTYKLASDVSIGTGRWIIKEGVTFSNKEATGNRIKFLSDGGIEVSGDSTDATAGPTVKIYRDSASPAANDYIGSVLFEGNDSAGNRIAYAELVAQITDATDGSEDAKLILRTMVNGTLTDALTLPGSSGGGGLTLISTQTASSSSSLDFTNVFDATYDEYIVEFQRLVPSAGGTNLRAQISNDGGSTWLNTLYTWGVREVTAGGALGTSNSSSDSSYRFNSTNVEGNGYAGLNGRMNIFDPLGKAFVWTADITHTDGANAYAIRNFCGGVRKDSSTTGYDSIKFYFDGTSNIVSGKIRIYGVTK